MVSRRTFIKAAVGAAAAAGAASTGLVAADSLFVYPKPGVKLRESSFVYTADEGAKAAGVWYLDKVGSEAMAAHFDAPGKGAQVLWNGFPAMLIKLDKEHSPSLQGKTEAANESGKLYPLVPGTPGVVDDIIGLWGICPHLCCRPNWRIAKPDQPWLVWCICHNSHYDPGSLVEDKSPDGTAYHGALWRAGPANRALPQIPLRVDPDGKIIGLAADPQWYLYCGTNLDTSKGT